MKLYKFLKGNKYIYTLADDILKAKKWIKFRYGEAKFITIEKVNYETVSHHSSKVDNLFG